MRLDISELSELKQAAAAIAASAGSRHPPARINGFLMQALIVLKDSEAGWV